MNKHKFLSFSVYVTINWCMLVMCYTGKVIITNNVDTTTSVKGVEPSTSWASATKLVAFGRLLR
jgi:hypothetical protein